MSIWFVVIPSLTCYNPVQFDLVMVHSIAAIIVGPQLLGSFIRQDGPVHSLANTALFKATPSLPCSKPGQVCPVQSQAKSALFQARPCHACKSGVAWSIRSTSPAYRIHCRRLDQCLTTDLVLVLSILRVSSAVLRQPCANIC